MNWVKWAVCVGFEWHTSDDAHHWEQAKLVCADCPVARTCAEAGMGEETGVWGGLDPLERDFILGRRSRLAGSSSQCLTCGTAIPRTGRPKKGNSGYRYCGDRCRRARRDVDDARRRHLLRLRDVFGAQTGTAPDTAGDDVPVAAAGGGVGLTGGLDQKAAS